MKVDKSLGVENNVFLHHYSSQEKMKIVVSFQTSPLREINWSLPSDSQRMVNKARESQSHPIKTHHLWYPGEFMTLSAANIFFSELQFLPAISKLSLKLGSELQLGLRGVLWN